MVSQAAILLPADIAVLSRSLRKLAVRFVRQDAHPACVDPAVVEIEERANGNRAVNSFVRPASPVQKLYVLVADSSCFMIHLGHKSKESLFFLGERRAFEVVQNLLNRFLAAKQFRRNCGVIFRSKRAMIASGCECCDQLPKSRTKWRVTPHYLLRKFGQMFGRLRTKCKQMPNLWVFVSARLHHADQVRMGARLRIVFDGA
jgi:hypothetical protein